MVGADSYTPLQMVVQREICVSPDRVGRNTACRLVTVNGAENPLPITQHTNLVRIDNFRGS